jgi:ATP-dependent Clp endopeptidase proteolytic subunit ClpP
MADEKEKKEVELPPIPRVVGLFTEIEEAKAEEIIYALRLFQAESEEEIEFIVSSPGGVATDMFAIYDFMRLTRESCPITTIGIRKVMSAAVLLLAAGSKGKRKVGKNCRIMIHSIIANSAGAINDLKNEMKEINSIQDLYIDALCEETNFTRSKLKYLFSKNVNIYLSAEEAVKYGIADIIV